LVLTQSDADDLNAVRINIPLSRVESAEKTQLPAFAGLVSLTFDPTSSNGARVSTEQSALPAEEASISDTLPAKQVLQLGVLREDPLWGKIMDHANRAKPMHRRATPIGQVREFCRFGSEDKQWLRSV